MTMAINVIEDITTHKRAERAQRFLADSAAVLAESLDPADVLGQVAALAVPEVADWVAVHMPGDAGIELVAIAHRDPGALERAEELDRAMPTRHDAPRGVANVLRTGRVRALPGRPASSSPAPTTSAPAPSTCGRSACARRWSCR